MGSMMRKTTVREIWKTFGRFMAILAIIALGVGFFSGVRETTPAMVSMMNDFLNDSQFYDYRLISTVGWDDEAVSAFAAQPDVRYAEGSISVDALWEHTNSSDTDREIVLKAHMLPRNINGLMLMDGVLPDSPNTCAADARSGIKVGDKICLTNENERDTLDTFVNSGDKWYTVVGTVQSSYYINFERGNTTIGNGSVSGFVYLPEESFYLDHYTEIFVRFDHDFEIYSDDYNDFIDGKTDDWEQIAQSEANRRLDDLLADARRELADGKAELEDERAKGQQELDDAKKELTDARKKLDDAKKELADSKKELDDGKKELDDAKAELDRGKSELSKAKKELDSSLKKLEASEKELSDGQAKLDEGKSELDAKYAEYSANFDAFYAQYGDAVAMLEYLPPEQQAAIRAGIAQLDEAKAQLDSAKSELDAKQAEIDAASAQLKDGRAKYNSGLADYNKAKNRLDKADSDYKKGLADYEDGSRKYEDGLAEYNDGERDYADGLAEYEDGLAEFAEKIADAEQEIADAEREINDVELPDVYVLGRNTNIGYACFESDSEIVAQVARVFPIFFILVAALVCMTTMSRMVEEQRTQIGMYKALGYSEAAIMGKFMFYSGSASLMGCVIGFFAGTWLFPAIIWVTYKLMYITMHLPYLFDWKLAIAAAAVSLLCSIGTTYISCRMELSETAASLMRPKAPKAGKRVFLEHVPFIWNRLKFLHKVSVRNIFRYKGRFFMMIIGIGGCMALLLTGFGLKDSIAGFADTQYDEIQTADAIVSFESAETDNADALLTKRNAVHVMFRKASWDMLYGSKVKAIDLEITDDLAEMKPFMTFRDLDGNPLDMPQTGEALVSHSVAERYGAAVGKEIVLRDENMRELRLTVSGVFENHVYNYIFISSETYAVQLGEMPEMNGAYVNFPEGADHGEESAAIASDSSIRAVEQLESTKVRLANMMSSLDYIVILVIACAAGLAFIVIYNLTNINITERTREIATIKVLGFFRNETSAYVLRENIALTAIGSAVGVVLGILLHRFVMAQIVVDLVDFSVRILPMSYVYSVILTFVFNFVVNIFMSFKLERINMAESLKSVD